MIRNFRKITQQVKMDRSTSKYLKYALGEIILVAIGILMALSINNWNINRIERLNEKLILNDLRVEFIENLKDAERVKKGNMGIVEAVGTIQNMSQNSPIDGETLDSLLYKVFDWFDYTPKPGASNNLINSGNLNLIQNRDLRKLLTLWSGVDDELDDDEQLAVNYSQNIIIPYMAEHYPMQNLEKYDLSDPYYSNLSYKKYAKRVEFDYKSLLEDPIFRSHISTKKLYAKHNTFECLNLIEACQSILELIDNELN